MYYLSVDVYYNTLKQVEQKMDPLIFQILGFESFSLESFWKVFFLKNTTCNYIYMTYRSYKNSEGK